MKNYNYILFDWDGCLAQTLTVWMKSYKEIFAKYQLHPTDHEISTKAFGDPHGPLKLGIKNLEEYNQKLNNLVTPRLKSVKLSENAFEVLNTLKEKGKKIALVTTSPRKMIKDPLKINKLNEIFDVILAAEDVKNHKPDPEVINLALEKMNGIKDEAIIIGDSKSDLGAAKNAGIDSILYYPKKNEVFYDLETLKTYDPTFVVSTFLEILEII